MTRIANVAHNLIRAPATFLSVVLGLVSAKASLASAIRRSDVPKVAVLLRRRHRNGSKLLTKALLLASRLGRVRIIDLLVQAGADPLAGNGAAIRSVAGIGSVPALEALIGTLGPGGGEARQTDASKAVLEHALLAAAFAGHTAVCRLLLESGANVDAREGGPSGFTSLMHGARVDDRDLLELMLSFGADANARTVGGYTALMLAALSDHVHVLRSLLAAGADPSLRDRKGRTARDLARSAAAAGLLAFTGDRGQTEL